MGLPAAFGSLMQQQPEQKPSRDWGRGLTDIGTSLMAAQAALDGNFGGSASLLGSVQERMAEQRQAAQAEQQRRAMAAAMAAKGIDPQVAGMFAGDPVAARQVLLPQQQQPQQPPAFVRNLEAWNQMTPEQQAQVARMQSVLNPQFTTGMDGQSYQRPPASTGNYDSDEWEDIPEEEARRLGGAGGNASGGFPRYR